jgi:hypothetical protein
MEDLFFELNYGDSGLGIDYETILETPYDTLSHWHKRYTDQKKYEQSETNKIKNRK